MTEYKIKIENDIVGLDKINPEAQKQTAPQETQKATQERLLGESKGAGTGKAIASYMGKQALSYALSNYGNLTGDHLGQTRINEGLEIAGLITMAASGWVGLAAAIGSVAVKGVNRFVDVRKSEIASEAIRQRIGLSRSGSRHD